MSLRSRRGAPRRPSARLPADSRVDVEALLSRVDALDRVARVAGPLVPGVDLTTAAGLVQRSRQRLAMARDRTVVALAGPTGSGKSSLFNALAGAALSEVGVRRPTTATSHSCAWGTASATRLLDWLQVPPPNRDTVTPLELDLDGLVLLDLPDVDSIAREHSVEADRLLAVVDLIVWVTDPQKYADQVIHEKYLQAFAGYQDVCVVLLNQADRLTPADARRCAEDLRGLLSADGLAGVPVLLTSTVAEPGLDELRKTLTAAVQRRHAALHRLATDVDSEARRLGALRGPMVDPSSDGSEPLLRLGRGLATACAGSAVADAAAQTYRHRATQAAGWLPLQIWTRLAGDPLQRLRLDQAGPQGPTRAQRAAVLRTLDAVRLPSAAGLPAVWAGAVHTAARSRHQEIPQALAAAVLGSRLVGHRPWWWLLLGALQWICLLASVTGLAWYATRALLAWFGSGSPALYRLAGVPAPAVLLAGGLALGILLAAAATPSVRSGARRTRQHAEQQVWTAATAVGQAYALAPMYQVLQRYAEVQDDLAVIGAAGGPDPQGYRSE